MKRNIVLSRFRGNSVHTCISLDEKKESMRKRLKRSLPNCNAPVKRRRENAPTLISNDYRPQHPKFAITEPIPDVEMERWKKENRIGDVPHRHGNEPCMAFRMPGISQNK